MNGSHQTHHAEQRKPAHAAHRTPVRHDTAAAALPPTSLHWFKTTITDELTQLSEDYQDMLLSLGQARRNGRSVAGDDPADIGTRAFENDQASHLTQNRRDLIVQLERALDRINEGTYGRCEGCREPIPQVRLEAFPAATLCVACKQSSEHH